jgi:hypothetical protein
MTYRIVGTTLVREGYAGMLCSESDSHLNEELLEKYAVGRLSDGQIAFIEEHLLICFECQLHLSGIDEYARVVKAATAELKNQPATRKPSLSELVFGRSGRGPLSIPMPVWATGLAILAVAVMIHYRPQSAIQTVSEVTLSAPKREKDAPRPHARAHSRIQLKIDTTSVSASPSYQVQVVDASGHEVWHSVLAPLNNEIRALLPEELKAGRYWVRLSTGSDLKLLQEYSFYVD